MKLTPATFDLVVESGLAIDAIELRCAGLARHGYRPTLSPAQDAEITAFLASLAANPYSPPTERIPAAGLLAYLSEEGLVELTSAGVVFGAEAFTKMVDQTRAHITANGSISLAETRDLFGNSRKYAQAFLEHLDALQITRRSGDTRTLR
jgi:selenocysteine-specific elongation factor